MLEKEKKMRKAILAHKLKNSGIKRSLIYKAQNKKELLKIIRKSWVYLISELIESF